MSREKREGDSPKFLSELQSTILKDVDMTREMQRVQIDDGQPDKDYVQNPVPFPNQMYEAEESPLLN